jgi:hypothetical protein
MRRSRATSGRARSPAARRPGRPATRPPARGGDRPAATPPRRRRFAVAAALAVVLVAGVAAVAAPRSHSSPARSGALPGLPTGPAPWTANTADLAARLRAIGVPPLSPMEGTAVHIHQHLDLYVDGRPVPVPALIGIDPAVGFAPLHTHDTSGVIHVESPAVRSYTLGQFFAVWGVRFTPTDLGGYHAGGGRQLRVYVNGVLDRDDPAALVLAPHQEIVVAFATTAQLPTPIPSTYQFPPGL